MNTAGSNLAAVPESESLRFVQKHSKELTAGFARLGATNVSVFGSVARGDDRPGSDIDLLVDIDESVGHFKLMRMKTLAEGILGCAVEVIPRQGLKDEVARAVTRDEVPL